MGIGIGYKIGNGNGKEWELTLRGIGGNGNVKTIPDHLYCLAKFQSHIFDLFDSID